MADTLVSGAVTSSLDQQSGLWGPYWSDPNIAYIICISGGDIKYTKTTDAGINWGSLVSMAVGSFMDIAAWFDQETPGDTGTKIHVVGLDDTTAANRAAYVNLDTSSDTVSSVIDVDTTVTVSSGKDDNRVALTKTVGGNLIFAYSTTTEVRCKKSSNEFSTDTTIADAYESGIETDYLLLFPANTADDNDATGIFWDRSANEISVKMYDDSANTWTETSIATSMTDDSQHINMDGSVRHSDNHILLIAHSNDDTTGDDLRSWDITVDSISSPTVTAKTNVFTNVAESAQCAIMINQQNDDVYVAYFKGGTWISAVDLFYVMSDDGMASWAGTTETQYSEDASDDLRRVQMGRTVGNNGGRFQPVFYNDDLADIYVNLTNDIEIVAAGGVNQASITLPQLSIDSTALLHGFSGLILPLFSLNTTSLNHASADLSLPLISINSIALNHSNVSLSLSLFTTDFSGHLGTDGAFSLPSLSVQGGSGATGHLTLPILTVTGTSLATTNDASVTLPLFSISSQAHLSADINITLPILTINTFTGALGNITLSQIVVVAGEADSGNVTLPLFTLSARAVKGSIPDCVVMNTINNAVSEYKEFWFNSYAKFNGVYIAANQNGIYEQDSSDMDEEAYTIKSHIKTGIIDSYNGNIQRLRNAWLSFKTDGDIQLSAKADKSISRKYLIDFLNKLGLKKRRVKFERGIRERYFDFKVENIDGSDLQIDKLAVTLEPILSKRR